MGTLTSTSKNSEITINTHRWSKVDLPYRLYYLEACRNNLRRVANFWVEEEANIRGHLPHSEAAAESWLTGPISVARILRYLINGVKSGGRPTVPSRRLRIDGRSVTRVFPHGFHEGVLCWETEAHVWSIGGQLQGRNYRRARDAAPGPALILGNSALSSISLTGILMKLFCANRPVVCKLSSRFAALKPIFEEVLHPLIRDRHLQIFCGGKDLGQKLLAWPEFTTVHLAGTRDTFQELQGSNPFAERSYTAQIGCVNPTIVLPGPWSQRELEYHAQHLASLMVFKGGYSCLAPQILVLSKNWSYKGAFLRALRAQLERLKERDDHYPGSPQRRESFRKRYPQGERYGPRTLVELSPHEPQLLFQEESLCGMLGWVEFESDRPEVFLKQAVEFCNQRLWGDLSCLLLIDPNTRRVNERAIAQALAALEYGTVGLNSFPGLAFMAGVTPWGSYLDGKADTGSGWMNNTFFFDRPEKTVIEGPFVPAAQLPWVKPFPKLSQLGASLFELELQTTAVSLLRFGKAYAHSLLEKGRSAGQK